MDAGTAQKYHFAVGDHVRILLAGPPRPSPSRASSVRHRQQPGRRDAGRVQPAHGPAALRLSRAATTPSTSLTTPGADKATVQRAIATVLPTGVEVVTGQTVANEQTNDINQALSFFSTALLVFAFISLFVGGFTIFNTFSIIVGQRTRELALLADRRAPAAARCSARCWARPLIVGRVASLVGLGLGVLAAVGLEALLKGFGITLPTGPLVFEARTVIVALVVGIGVTVVSAVSPARRAVRIPPVAALADHRAEDQESSRRRMAFGSVIAALGVVALAFGLTKPAIQLVGVGAVAVFIGIGMLAPLVARPMASVLGRPLARLLGICGSTRTGELHAQSPPDRPDGLGAHGRAGAGLDHCRVRGVTVQVGDQQRRRRGQRRLHHHQSHRRVPAASATRWRRRRRGPGRDGRLDRLQRAFEFGAAFRRSPRSRPSTCPRRSSCGWPTAPVLAALAAGDLLIDTTTANTKHLSVGSEVPVKFAADRTDHHADRGDIQAQCPDRQLSGR